MLWSFHTNITRHILLLNQRTTENYAMTFIEDYMLLIHTPVGDITQRPMNLELIINHLCSEVTKSNHHFQIGKTKSEPLDLQLEITKLI